jgi:sulfate adenylyltransferase subunit 2
MDRLHRLICESVYVIREAQARYRRLGVLWSMGKDSTLLLWLCRKAFLGKVPFPVVHIDTSYKLPEMYVFRDRLAREWGLDLRVVRNEEALAQGVGPETEDVLACCHALKTLALREAIEGLGLDAVLLGIRRDEHGVRAKERYFSARTSDFLWAVGGQPPELWDLYASVADAGHARIHPLLHFAEMDVWEATRAEGIPVNPLYFSRDGWRYRSIGCGPCCVPVASEAGTVAAVIEELATASTPERAGRAQDKEASFTMQKLRSLGYM